MRAFLGWEDPLREEMAICSKTLARRILWTEETGELQSMDSRAEAQLQDPEQHLTHNTQ